MKRQGHFCSPSSSSSKKNKLPTLFPEKTRRRFQSITSGAQKRPPSKSTLRCIQGFFMSKTKKTASPSSSSGNVLILIGQSREKVCFENQSSKTFCIWHLKKEHMENEVEFEWGIPAAHGFGHTRTVQLKIVRFLIPPFDPSSFSVEICKENKKKKLVWAKKEVKSLVQYYPSEEDFAKLVSKDSMLFWKRGLGDEVQIIKFDLENEDLGLLKPPQDDDLKLRNISLGHGFQGRLSSCVYTLHSSLATRTFLKAPCLDS